MDLYLKADSAHSALFKYYSCYCTAVHASKLRNGTYRNISKLRQYRYPLCRQNYFYGPYTSITAIFCRCVMPLKCSCSLKIAILFIPGIIKCTVIYTSILPYRLQTEAPVLVDVIQNTIGNHEKQSVMQSVVS